MEDRNQRSWPATADTNGGTVTPGMIMGLAIVAIGVLFLLDNFGFPVGVVWHYWPIILVAVGLAKLLDSKDTSGRTGGAIMMVIGIVLIGDEIHLPFLHGVSLWSLWPLAIIVVGAMMLWSALEGKSIAAPWAVNSSTDRINMFSVFGGGNRKVTGDFKGAELIAIFGGGGLDLRFASMSADEAIVNVTAVFGGFEIKAPESWQVSTQVTGIFGGHEDKTHQPDPRLVPNPKRLVIRGATIFGGLGVKND